MFRATRHAGLRGLQRSSAALSFFGSSASPSFPQVNPRVDLDPALRDLLRDVDMSLGGKKQRSRGPHDPLKRELQQFMELQQNTSVIVTDQADDIEFDPQEAEHDVEGRKSPAAAFGSSGIGDVVLPLELQNSINLIISEGDKKQLRSDAQRLFQDQNDEDGFEDSWTAKYDKRYSTRSQTLRHSERDGSAFASVALPAHYSVITAVLQHVKRRLEPEWRVERIIDWGAGTGSGLWGGGYAFQTPKPEAEPVDLALANTTVRHYLGIDKREGLVTVGKRLLRDIDTGPLRVSWHKSFREEDGIPRSEGHHTVALSAFMLTSLATYVARKALVKEMWSSGAHVLILIDHNTKEGFESIAEARDYLLNVGRKEFNDPEADDWDIRGSHVVAPCPHDHGCPLNFPGDIKLICGFSQRLQRPSFVRRTKHAGDGHEDMGYSYIVIRRGPRPSNPGTTLGRVGRVGHIAVEKELSKQPVKELSLHDEHEAALPAEEPEPSMDPLEEFRALKDHMSPTALDAALRLEAYNWPRLIFPPLKKSGHIILDGCTPEGKIMRMTIPRSQGKQPFYDARKSSWGDIFPHPPKNPPQVRHQPLRVKGKELPVKNGDIGKRGGKEKKKGVNYESLAVDIKAERKKTKQARIARKRSQETEEVNYDLDG
ncbi:mitochondrial small ribosomal subunit Rsm22-domain-containing protein [Mycena belliarum]|uniref:Mitochondrial small ribosomal subunit Rsm22-domain-containing protein n=1 Tax=Mycena belliarum TaxID=1033014 RepID=A0AAD6XVV6_9AGAR|nr:mitochondrial small ribosomal subunit Rsm22-domain-containing protein [Mycena belliae]